MSAPDPYPSRRPSVRSTRRVAARPPAGFFPVLPNALFDFITMAGCEIHCAACSTFGRLPLPGAANYGAEIEIFVELHKGHADAHRGAA